MFSKVYFRMTEFRIFLSLLKLKRNEIGLISESGCVRYINTATKLFNEKFPSYRSIKAAHIFIVPI